MVRFTNQVATLRPLARMYRILLLIVPAALAGCQGGDSLAPDASSPGDLSPPGAQSHAVEDVGSADALGALGTDRIAFSSLLAGNASDIWTMSPTGTGGTRLTSFTGSETEPTWSWDHQRIAFVRMRSGVPDIYLMKADGTNKHWARSTPSQNTIDMPSWSPDGSNLVVRVYQSKPCVAKIDLATGALTLLAPAGLTSLEGSYPIYANDGKAIYYVDRSLMTIKRFTPGGADETVLALADYVGDLALSPDGTRLAYYAYVNGTNNSEIYVLNLATKVVKRLTNQSKNDWNPTWSPDGTKLAFSSNRSGKLQIYTTNSSIGGSPTQITSKTYGAYEPAWVY